MLGAFHVFRLYRAVRFLFLGPFVLLLLFIVNLMTWNGHWWVQWAALGIGIAWALCLLRVARAAIVLGGIAALAAYLNRQKTQSL
jgi:hypothetical protein